MKLKWGKLVEFGPEINHSTSDPFWSLLFPAGGLILFGLCSMIMDIFKIAYYVGYLHCDSAVKVVFPIIQAIFIFVQVSHPVFLIN